MMVGNKLGTYMFICVQKKNSMGHYLTKQSTTIAPLHIKNAFKLPESQNTLDVHYEHPIIVSS